MNTSKILITRTSSSILPHMNQPCCEGEVRRFLKDEGILELPDQADAKTDLFAHGLDSLAVMQLVVAIEHRWGVALTTQTITREAIGTPERLATTINTHS